jgi:hypothetical protein
MRDITVLTRSLFVAPLDCAALEQLTDCSLQLSQLALAELRRIDEGLPSAAPTLLAELLDENAALLESIHAERRAIVDAREIAASLQTWIDDLLSRPESAARRWLSGVDDFVVRARELTIEPLHRLKDWLGTAEPRSQWLAQAITTARLTAALSEALIDGDPNAARWLTAAALVQDIGRWTLEDRLAGSERVRVLVERQHAAVGAAILAGVRHCPTEIVLLVGAHHERLDGSGGPQRLSGRALSRRMQVLGLIVRFCELAGEAQQPGLSEDAGLLTAALALWREVLRGAFSEDLSKAFLNLLDAGLAERVAAAHAERSQLFVDRKHAVPQPHASLESPAAPSSAPQPMFLRRQRAGDRRGRLQSAHPVGPV